MWAACMVRSVFLQQGGDLHRETCFRFHHLQHGETVEAKSPWQGLLEGQEGKKTVGYQYNAPLSLHFLKNMRIIDALQRSVFFCLLLMQIEYGVLLVTCGCFINFSLHCFFYSKPDCLLFILCFLCHTGQLTMSHRAVFTYCRSLTARDPEPRAQPLIEALASEPGDPVAF